MSTMEIEIAAFSLLVGGFFIFCLIPDERARSELPFRLLILAIMLVLFVLQTTFFWKYPVYGVRLELLPPLILFVALTTNFSMTVAASLLAAVLYDTASPVKLGSSFLPYVIGGGIFCAIRPMLYRNSWLTRFVSGWSICMIILFFQWIAFRIGGMAELPFWEVIRTLFKLSIFGGCLSIIYFAAIDLIARMLDLLPPQEGEINYARVR